MTKSKSGLENDRKRLESAVEFLGEQDGIPERELKSALLGVFQETPALQGAYLARVRYLENSDYNVALCLIIPSESATVLVSRIAELYSAMFNSDSKLDIMMINELQELQISKICRPFFIRN